MTTLRTCVFPCAGFGTRFFPATKVIPKEMLPLVDKPILQYGIEEALGSGMDKLVVVLSKGKDAILDHFDRTAELERSLQERKKNDLLDEVETVSRMADIISVRQKEALGLGHAVLQAKDVVGSEPFAVMLSDDIINAEVPALKQMLDVYEKYDAPVLGTMQVEGEAISRFGAIDAEEVEEGVYRVHEMVEKPPFAEAPSDLAIIGRYILTPDIFEELENTKPGAGGEIQLTDAMRNLSKKRPFYAVRFKGI